MTDKEVQIFNKKVDYKNIYDLANKLNIKRNDTKKQKKDNAKQILKNTKKDLIIYNETDGSMQQIDIGKNAPLLIRDFTGLNRINKTFKENIIINDYEKKDFKFNINDEEYSIRDKKQPFNDTNQIIITFDLKVRLILSQMRGTKKDKAERNITGTYKGTLSTVELDILKNLIIKPKRRFLNNREIKDYNVYSPTDKMTEKTLKNNEFIEKNEIKENKINKDELTPFIKHLTDLMFKMYGMMQYIIVDKLESVQTAVSKREFDLKTMKMKLADNYNISINLYNEIIEINDDENKCVVNYLKKKYKKINVEQYFNKLDININEGISTEQLLKFCEKYKIKLIAYDIKGELIAKYKPVNKNKSYGALIYISYSNHIYPVNNKYLHKINYDDLKYENITLKKINNKFIELINNKIIPNAVSYKINNYEESIENKILITSFIHEKTQYYNNEDYDFCYKILKLFQCEDKMTPYTNRYNIIKILENLYNVGMVDSFIPMIKDNKGIIFNWITDNKDLLKKEYEKDWITLDKNKCYAHALYKLLFLIQIDIRKAKINKNLSKDHKITEHYLYNVSPHFFNVLIPMSGFYTGYDLLYALQYNINFDIIEEYEAERIENPFSNLIKDYYNKTKIFKSQEEKELIKLIINIWIGKFDKNTETTNYETIDKICNKDESDLTNGEFIDYSDDIKFFLKTNKKASIYTRQLIKYQLLNESRRVLFEKMMQLKLTSSDIIQIKTDAITFYKKDFNIKNNLETDKDNFKGWKLENKNYLMKCGLTYDNEIITIKKNPYNVFLNLGYAGCGKSYEIMRRVDKLKHDNYIILSPSHSTIEEYKLNNYKSNVISKYTYNNEIPTEEIIYIDEIGLTNREMNDFIFKCIISNKKIRAYGDYKQLKPVLDEPYDNKLYLESYFNIKYNTCNYRNNFKIEYYDELINNKINLIEEIKKYMCKSLYDAEYIICHSNTACDIYNEKIMKHKNISSIYQKGCLMMCKTNELRNIELYNNFIVEVVECDDKNIILKDKNKQYKLTLKQYNKTGYFKPAYARTLYNMQGRSINSYYIPDKSLEFFNDGRSAYTIISRLKQELTEETKERNKKILEDKEIINKSEGVKLDINEIFNYVF